jgi:hypothetical protein
MNSRPHIGEAQHAAKAIPTPAGPLSSALRIDAMYVRLTPLIIPPVVQKMGIYGPFCRG